MSYVTVEDFTAGLDKRRGPETSKAGVLVDCKNAHITRGGEIEQAKKFVAKYTGLANTFGMHGTDNKLYVFGSVAPFTLPPGINYQRLQHPTGVAMERILDSDNFNGQIFAIAKFTDGNIYAYYNGVRIADWDTRATSFTSINRVAKVLGDLIDANDAVDATVNNNVITIISKTIGVPITVFYSTANGGGVNDQDITLVETVASAPTTYHTYTATLIGTFETADRWTITVNGTAYIVTGLSAGMPTTAITYGQKIYSTVGSLLNFSSIDHPELVTSGTGFGFINIANHASGSETLTGLELYQNNMAVFSRNAIQLWFLDADPANNAKQQVIRNSGTRAPRSVISFGDTDVFYLHDSGVRSIRSRAGYSAAFVSDVGTAIDTYIQEHVASLGESVVEQSIAILDNRDGRYWLAIASKIFVFSYSPTAKISAWSEYNRPYDVSDMIAIGQDVFLRSGATIYRYGGDTGTEYDSATNDPVTVQLSFMTAGKVATDKFITGIDLASEGRWYMEILVDPNDITKTIPVGELTGSSYTKLDIALPGHTTSFAPKFTSRGTGKHMLKKVTIHFNFDDDD